MSTPNVEITSLDPQTTDVEVDFIFPAPSTVEPTDESDSKTPDEESSPKKSAVPAWHTDFEPEDKGWRNIRWLLWWAYGFLQLYRFQWIRPPHTWEGRNNRIEKNSRAMWLMGHLLFATYLYRSVKGGSGKTTGATWVSSEVALRTSKSTLVVDLDSGAKGKAAQRFSIDIASEAYPLQEVQNLIIEKRATPTHDELQRMLPVHQETGATLLAPSQKIVLTTHKTERLLNALNPSFGVIFIDTTPGVKEDNTEGAQRRTTITVIPTDFTSEELYADIQAIRDHMNEDESGDPKGLFDQLKEQDRLFVEVNAVPAAHFNRRTQYKIAQRLNLQPHQVILMPYEKHIYARGIVSRSKVSLRYRYAVNEQARTLTEYAARHNEAHPWAGPEVPFKGDTDRQRDSAARRLVDLHDGDFHEAAKHIMGLGIKK